MQDNKYIILGIEYADSEIREILANREKKVFLSDRGEEFISSINNIIELNKKALSNKNLDDEIRGNLEKLEENSKNLVDIVNVFQEKNWIL